MCDLVDAILKVLVTLDYLKLCVDHNMPTGDGVPVDIVVMPDLVIDVDGATITRLNEQKHMHAKPMLAPAEIGSRAGRVVSILSHLRDLDDEGFRLHYITKTGHIGQAVLEDRFGRSLHENGLQPLRFPLLTSGKVTRHAVLGRDLYTEYVRRQIARPNKDTLLTVDELKRHFYSPIRTIQEARALYFATDSLEQFKQLINIAVLGETLDEAKDDLKHGGQLQKTVPGDRHVFIDLSAIQDEKGETAAGVLGLQELQQVVDILPDLVPETDKKTTPIGVAESTYLTCVLRQRSVVKLQEVFNDLKMRKDIDTLLVYSDKDIHWYNGTDQDSSDLNFHSPWGRDAFIAGLLLYRAVGAAWKCIPDASKMKYKLAPEKNWTCDIFPDPYSSSKKPNSWPFTEAVGFAKSLAKLWMAPFEEVPNKRMLLWKNATAKARKYWTFTQRGHVEEKLVKATRRPRDWCLGVSLLARGWIVRGHKLQKDISKTFVGHLQQEVTTHSLGWHPESWKMNRTQALRIATKATVRAQFALQTLRRMAIVPNRTEFPLFNNSSRAYLSDLDGTLVYSSGLRRLCLRRAFLAMLSQSPPAYENMEKFPLLLTEVRLKRGRQLTDSGKARISVSDFLNHCAHFYDAAIYSNWEEWEKIFRDYPYYLYGDLPKDFRQVWNHPLSYPLFIWIVDHMSEEYDFGLENLTPPEVLIAAMNASGQSVLLSVPDDPKEARKWIVESLPDWLRTFGWRSKKDDKRKWKGRLAGFFTEIATWEQKHRRFFECAINAFWDVEYEPYRQTREVLRTLRNVFGVRLYVATEGHHDTQLSKIRTVGLQEFFPESVTMSTGAAANQYEDEVVIQNAVREHRNDLAIVTIKLDARRDDLRKLMKQHPAITGEIGEVFRKAIKKDDRRLRQLQSEMKYLTDVYRQEWENFREKPLGKIYCLILASVLVDPEKPTVALTNLRHLELNLESEMGPIKATRFVMIGDRESKDIGPLLEQVDSLNVNTKGKRQDLVTTVRLLTMDHTNEDLYWTKEKPRAQYVAWSPVQALLLLSYMRGWRAKLRYGSLPPIVQGRLAEADGTIKGDYFDAMAWGKIQRLAPYSLINYLITQSTIQDCWPSILSFTENLALKLSESRRNRRWDHYHLAWGIARQLTSWLIPMGGNVEQVAGMLRDIVCAEIQEGFGVNDLSHQAVDLLTAVSRHCSPPRRWPPYRNLDFEAQGRLTALRRKWKKR